MLFQRGSFALIGVNKGHIEFITIRRELLIHNIFVVWIVEGHVRDVISEVADIFFWNGAHRRASRVAWFLVDGGEERFLRFRARVDAFPVAILILFVVVDAEDPKELCDLNQVFPNSLKYLNAIPNSLLQRNYILIVLDVLCYFGVDADSFSFMQFTLNRHNLPF